LAFHLLGALAGALSPADRDDNSHEQLRVELHRHFTSGQATGTPG
jgi:hypothetical protein